jgi:hypothetical protein
MPHFDYTINVGSIAILVTVISIWIAFKARTETILQHHTETMTALDHAFEEHERIDRQRFDHLEGRLLDLTVGIERLAGRTGIRHAPRPSDR